MKTKTAIFCEASQEFGTGHLIESINLARLLSCRRFDVSIWANAGVSVNLLNDIPVPVFSYNDLGQESEVIASALNQQGYSIVVFNLRLLQDSLVRRFRDFTTVAIDELGMRKLDCDVVINAMIAKQYHEYDAGDKTRFYFGPRYLITSEGLAATHEKPRTFKGAIKKICISMGGCDRSGATLRIVDILSLWNPEIDTDIILGGACPYREELLKKTESSPNFHVYQNVSGIESFFSQADIVFTAGGNTLYELACVGTPPIILYEDDHERVSGQTFEELGFGFCPGSGTGASVDGILRSLEKFNNPTVRLSHSNIGKSLVDGKGALRIASIIERLANTYDQPI